jgi:repressor LexA
MRSYFSEHLPNNLRFLRKYYDYTQKELAEPFDISQEGYSKWERGISTPSLGRLQKIADFYKIAIPDILNKKPEDLLRIVLEQNIAPSP